MRNNRKMYYMTDARAFEALSTLSPKTATVAEDGDCRRKRQENGDSHRIRRQSHFSATVVVFGDKLSPKWATVWTGFNNDGS